MEQILFLLGGIILFLLIFLIIKINSFQSPKNDDSQKIMLEVIENLRRTINETESKNKAELQNRFDTMTKQLNIHQHQNLETLQKQFGQSAKIIEDVTHKLTKLDETNKQVVSFAEQMKSLENILKNPKQRGILGEFLLESLLGDVLTPTQYKIQYSFKNGEAVDAVIFFRDKIIPIDAKFSLEKYNLMMKEQDEHRRSVIEREFKSDIKARIDETSKYIRPNEDTTDFAFMFIPAEGIYYNLLVYNVGSIDVNTQDLIEYAFKKHVIIVSPISFYAYLETVLQGLKALKMEKSVKDVLKRVSMLDRHLKSFESFMSKLGNNLSTTVNTYNNATSEFAKIDKDIYKITDGENGRQIKNLITIEGPQDQL